ncbi:MAG: Gfo/Idh/MocA family oxidoreductase [Fimbriimonadaceae bacterium]|nr:Gfo/Idh/MocA family oxidoreductase [Fimbriimonadaceae bacterium]
MELRWGILGTGLIARRFAQGLSGVREQRLQAVGSRSEESARRIVEEYTARAYGSYEEVLDDPLVDVAYIALPHHLHAEWTVKAARAGKHVLCEKPFALSAPEAEAALDEVRRCEVFFMEGFMYRCHPQNIELHRFVTSGELGSIERIHAEFGFNASRDWRNFRTDPALGGGALMDVGCYCVSMCRWLVGEEPTEARYDVRLSSSGYDEHGKGWLEFPSGVKATFTTGMHDEYDNRVEIVCEKGRIVVPSPWFCDESYEIVTDTETRKVRLGEDLDLFGNEAVVVGEWIERRQCPFVTWEDTLANARVLDRLSESAKA